MILSFLYVILAILGLSFLIFIHEFGHYWMARRVGMKVEIFSIGFGRPLISWMRDGVRWQIGWLLFGGYVKIAGQEIDPDVDPYTVPDGFFGKTPWQRIQVAFMGPFVNILAALLIFSGLWLLGGRSKDFADFTHKIGWIDPQSELYNQGVRPGDEITAYDGHALIESKDHFYAPAVAYQDILVEGNKVNYQTGLKTPFSYKIKTYPHPNTLDKSMKTAGVLNSASYIIYDKLQNGAPNPLMEGSPLQASGIEYGDRIVAIDGEILFSVSQLNHILNDHKLLLTIVREGKTLLRRVPRVPVQELKLDSAFKEELIDWQFEAQLNNTKFQKLWIIPYNLTTNCVVENELKFIDKEHQLEAFPLVAFADKETALQVGDKIIAIDGQPIKKSYELLAQTQVHYVNLIVQRALNGLKKVAMEEADQDFDREIEVSDIEKLVSSIGTEHPLQNSGNFYLLKRIMPKTQADFSISLEKKAWFTAEKLEQKKQVEAIEDSEKRTQALTYLEMKEKQLLLGLPAQDRKVTYNPAPLALFEIVAQQIWHTLEALFSGTMNPKWLSGPVGIVQAVHDYSMVSLKEALFWLGAISLNLGMLNLLPIPVLDGGTILICLIEMITRRKINPKTLEKVVVPFAIILITFFVFLTYHDLSRLFKGFLN